MPQLPLADSDLCKDEYLAHVFQSGRKPLLQRGCRGFESLRVHQTHVTHMGVASWPGVRVPHRARGSERSGEIAEAQERSRLRGGRALAAANLDHVV